MFRVTQGLSAALMIPAALAVSSRRIRSPNAAARWPCSSASPAASPPSGPIAGGYLTAWTWRAIFWINIPVAIVAVVLTLAAGLQSVPRREKIDWPGAVLVAAGMALSVLGFEQASSWGWDSALTWGCIVRRTACCWSSSCWSSCAPGSR